MLTEQEVLAYINGKSDLRPGTQRLINKLKLMRQAIQDKDREHKGLQSDIRIVEDDILRLRGAISLLIEMIAEEEGLISELNQNPDQS